MSLSPAEITQILQFLDARNTSILGLCMKALEAQPEMPAFRVQEVPQLLDAIFAHAQCRSVAMEWIFPFVQQYYAAELLRLTKKDAGWHFNAQSTQGKQLDEFDLDTMASQLQELAPHLCDLIILLLSADPRSNADRERRKVIRETKGRAQKSASADDPGRSDMGLMDDAERHEDDGYWDLVDDAVIQEAMAGDMGAQGSIEDRRMAIRQREITIKRVTCMSIMMQSTNQNCNALQCVIGLYMHSCNTPEAVIEIFAHAGCSVSITSIHNAVTNLSEESSVNIMELGQKLLSYYVYDNLDADIKQLVPTAENPNNTLIHITAATLIPLEHGVTSEDLDCSDELWRKSRLNPSALPGDIPGGIDMFQLLNLATISDYPEPPYHRDRFNTWMFLHTLVYHGPSYFRRYKSILGQPEVIEQIPIVKTHQVPLKAMDINPSTVNGNAEVFAEMFRQGGIGDPSEDGQEDMTDVGNQVIIVQGDLGTGEKIESLQRSRSAEKTPWRRLQMVIFVPGLFHLKMACADALWRIFIEPKDSQGDPNSLLSHVGRIRPNETLKFASNPGFRRMHEAIQHTGIVSRLQCWRVKAGKLPGRYQDLESFAKSNPEWQTLQQLASQMVTEFVAGPNLSELRGRSRAERDIDLENLLLRQRYFLLYEEVTYAMNVGDIGRIENCFMPWVFIFRACGKHKYASFMMKYLHNVHFVYPDGLKHAVRMNILCNPTGKEGKLRANDWQQEHNNLFTKTMKGGEGSNYQKERIIKESPLIEVYRNIRVQLQDMFELNSQTTKHTLPDMEQTFNVLAQYMQTNQAFVYTPGRSARYTIPDSLVDGMGILLRSDTFDHVEIAGEPSDVNDEREVEDEDDLLE